jgi:hypothetical protein
LSLLRQGEAAQDRLNYVTRLPAVEGRAAGLEARRARVPAIGFPGSDLTWHDVLA